MVSVMFGWLALLHVVFSKYVPKLHEPPSLSHRKHRARDSDHVNDFQTECGIREIALNFSQTIINRYSDRIYDALQLNECINQSIPYKNNRDYHQINPVFNHQFNEYLQNLVYNDNAMNIQLITFYVDINNGNDKNTGRDINNPFQHIKTAKNTIRSMKNSENISYQFIVYIRGGMYFEGSFNFDIDDNGLSDLQPTIYTAYNNEIVTISGGAEIKSLHFENYKATNTMYAKLNGTYSFDQLFINGTTRLIRARSPSGNPEIDIQPTNYAFCQGGYNGQKHFPNDAIFVNITTPSRNSSIYPWFGTDKDWREPHGWQAYHFGGDAIRYSDNKGFYNGSIPAGLSYNITTNPSLHLNKTFINNPLSPFIVNVFHPGLWGNWHFIIDDLNKTQNGQIGQIGFGSGGYQEAHGGYIGGQPFYVENDMQCLDDDDEWFLYIDQQTLYLNPNKSNKIFMNAIKNVKKDNNGNFVSFDLDIQFPTNHRILVIEGDSVKKPVGNLQFNGIIFTHSLRTQLLGYEVPSGGDWSIHRGGAIFLQNAQNITFTSCTFLRNGGNDIFLSDYNYNINITSNNFLYSGDSSIGIVGRVDLLDGFSDIDYSNNIYIHSNYMELIGVFGKQTSAVFTSVAGQVIMTNNVAHSGARAGINLNDGFYGGKIIENNLLFNWVRETQDHGPINTWDRVEYIFANHSNVNAPTQIPKWNRIVHNLIYCGPSGNRGGANLFPAVDNDDGSRFYWITDNLFLFGGAKNFLGDDKIWKRNLIIFPCHWPGNMNCISAWTGLGHVFGDNQCIANQPDPLFYDACNPNDFKSSSDEMPFGFNNSIYVPNADFVFECGNQNWTLKDLQNHGWELDSTVNDVPPSQTIVNMAKNKIL